MIIEELGTELNGINRIEEKPDKIDYTLNEPMIIPKIIHQLWKTEEIPEHWKKSKDMWIKHHPDYKYILWTDKMMRKFMVENYPDYIDLYDSYELNIQRVDSFRYFVLKKMGGIYSDLDCYPSQSIDGFINKGCEAYFVRSKNVGVFSNFFMVSAPNAKIWDSVIPALRDAKKQPWYISVIMQLYVLHSTGPVFLNGKINEYSSTLGLLPSSTFSGYGLDDMKGGKYIFKKECVLHSLTGSSWCEGPTTSFFHWFYRNRYAMYIIGIAILVCAVLMAIVFPIKYFALRRKVYSSRGDGGSVYS